MSAAGVCLKVVQRYTSTEQFENFDSHRQHRVRFEGRVQAAKRKRKTDMNFSGLLYNDFKWIFVSRNFCEMK